MSPAPAHHCALKGGARGRTARAIAIDLNCVGSAGSWALADLSLHASPGGSEAPYAFGAFYLYAETLANHKNHASFSMDCGTESWCRESTTAERTH